MKPVAAGTRPRWTIAPMADAWLKVPMLVAALAITAWAFGSGARIPLWTLSVAAWVGLVFLAFTLLPPLLLRARLFPSQAERFRALLRKRRTWGLMAALCFWVHYNLAVEMLRQRYDPADIQARYDSVLDPGQLSAFIFLILFLTSYDWARRLLKQDWKRLQSLVWFAVPLILVHSISAKAAFEESLTHISLLLLLLVIAAALLEFRRLGAGHKDRFRHVALLGLGLLVALGLRFGSSGSAIL